MSEAMNSGALQRSSSIVSRAQCAGALSYWKVNVSRKTTYCRQKFSQQNIPVLSVNPCYGSRNINISSLSASKF